MKDSRKGKTACFAKWKGICNVDMTQAEQEYLSRSSAIFHISTISNSSQLFNLIDN